MNNKLKYSRLQEKDVAKLVNGNVQIASGGLSHNGGDVLTNDWFFECKTVTSDKNSYSVKKSVIEKAKEQCFEQMKEYWALVFRFSPEGKDYFVIDEDVFLHLMKCAHIVDSFE